MTDDDCCPECGPICACEYWTDWLIVGPLFLVGCVVVAIVSVVDWWRRVA